MTKPLRVLPFDTRPEYVTSSGLLVSTLRSYRIWGQYVYSWPVRGKRPVLTLPNQFLRTKTVDAVQNVGPCKNTILPFDVNETDWQDCTKVVVGYPPSKWSSPHILVSPREMTNDRHIGFDGEKGVRPNDYTVTNEVKSDPVEWSPEPDGGNPRTHVQMDRVGRVRHGDWGGTSVSYLGPSDS